MKKNLILERRRFIRKILGSVALSSLTGLSLVSAGYDYRKKLKDNFWLWGQDAGSHHRGSPEGGYSIPRTNLMEPREGADFFGIEKILRVSMSAGPFPPWDEEAEKIKDMKEVVWSAIGAGGIKGHYENEQSHLDEVLLMQKITQMSPGLF